MVPGEDFAEVYIKQQKVRKYTKIIIIFQNNEIKYISWLSEYHLLKVLKPLKNVYCLYMYTFKSCHRVCVVYSLQFYLFNPNIVEQPDVGKL